MDWQHLHAPAELLGRLQGGGEHRLAHLRVAVVVRYPDPVLHQALVPRVVRPGGGDLEPVVVGHVLERVVQQEGVPGVLQHRRLEVVRHEDPGDAAQVLEAHPEGVYELLDRLALDHHDGDVVAVGKDGEEHLHLPDLPGHDVHHVEPVAREVDEEVFAGAVRARLRGGDRRRGRADDPVHVLVELGLPVSVGMLDAVFAVKRTHRHVGVLLPGKLLPDVGDHLEETLHAGVRVGLVALEQDPVQLVVLRLQELGHGYPQPLARGAGPLDVVLDGASGNAVLAFYRPEALSVHPLHEDLLYFFHRFPFSRHLLSRFSVC